MIWLSTRSPITIRKDTRAKVCPDNSCNSSETSPAKSTLVAVGGLISTTSLIMEDMDVDADPII